MGMVLRRFSASARGDRPLRSGVSGSAEYSRSTFMVAVWRYPVAMCNAVKPGGVGVCTCGGFIYWVL